MSSKGFLGPKARMSKQLDTQDWPPRPSPWIQLEPPLLICTRLPEPPLRCHLSWQPFGWMLDPNSWSSARSKLMERLYDLRVETRKLPAKVKDFLEDYMASFRIKCPREPKPAISLEWFGNVVTTFNNAMTECIADKAPHVACGIFLYSITYDYFLCMIKVSKAYAMSVCQCKSAKWSNSHQDIQ